MQKFKNRFSSHFYCLGGVVNKKIFLIFLVNVFDAKNVPTWTSFPSCSGLGGAMLWRHKGTTWSSSCSLKNRLDAKLYRIIAQLSWKAAGVEARTAWRMVKRCVAAGCSNTYSDGVSLFAFPRDPSLRQEWLKQVQKTRARWSGPSKHSVLCSCRFTEDCFEPDTLLETFRFPIFGSYV